jgi:hypothetical protein
MIIKKKYMSPHGKHMINVRITMDMTSGIYRIDVNGYEFRKNV